MGRADAAHLSVRRLSRSEWRIVERLDVERPRVEVRPADRKVHRVSVASPDQYSPDFHRQHHHAGDLLGRQQPPRRHSQDRTARLERGRSDRLPTIPNGPHPEEAALLRGRLEGWTQALTRSILRDAVLRTAPQDEVVDFFMHPKAGSVSTATMRSMEFRFRDT